MGIYLNSRKTLCFVLLLIIVSLLYSSTLHAPFNFDDEAVVKYDIVQKEAREWFATFYPPRYRHLFYSSLIFNYSQGGLNPFGYHLVNTSFHLLTSIVIFFIASITIKKGLSLGRKEAFLIASMTALLFATNPVNSETVNYISARAVGMSSFFYFSALLSFIIGSLHNKKIRSRFSLYILSLTCFLAAVLSKETALTFPIALLLYDFCFMREESWISLKNRLLFFYLPSFLCTTFAILQIVSLKIMIIGWWQKIDFEYALKQVQIVGHAARLILLPIGLTFDYHFPNNFFSSYILLSITVFLIIGIIIAISIYFPKARVIIFFSIFWFLITLTPTNSVIPRSDLLSERNLYLPSFGILFLLSTATCQLVIASKDQSLAKKISISCLVIFFLLQVILLHKRNLTYRSNILLWEDTLKKSPGKLRALHNLSHFYISEKKYTKAFITLRTLAKSNASPHYIAYAHSNLGSIYLQLGDYQKAEKEFNSGIKAKPSLPTNYFNLGTLLASQGRNLEAKSSYEKAEESYKNYQWGYPTPVELYINKARLLLKLKLYDQAESSINDYLNRAPKSGPGHFIRANIFLATGRLEQALHEYNQITDSPKLEAEAHNNRALIFIKKNSFKQALEELNQAINIFPNLIDAHYNLGNLLIQTNGNLINARWHLEKALKLTTGKEGIERIKNALKSLS